jgi:phosphinothricin acetyltransferase
MALQMRTATEDDLGFIVDVYNSIIPGGEVTADTEPVTTAAWILEKDGTPCGWMSFSDYYGRPAYAITAEVSIYLAEPWRRQGLGGKFLAMGLEYIRDHGVKSVLAFVFDSNLSSVRLFEQAGFSRWGLLPGACLINGTEKDVGILGIRLG